MNQKTRKLTTAEEVQDRTSKQKEEHDYVRVEQGDVMKFGRVRFRVKTLVTEMMHNDDADITKTESRSPGPNIGKAGGPHFGITSNLNRIHSHQPATL